MQRRPEGFPGQRLVVLPQSVRHAVAHHPLLRGLLVTDAGFYPRAAGHCMERPQGAATHLVISCLRGCGWVESHAERRQVSAGDLLWLRAHEPHAYGADEADPWTIAWIHFSGTESEGWHRFGGFAEEPIAVLRGVSTEGNASLELEEIPQVLEKGYSDSNLVLATIMLRNALHQAAEVVRSGRCGSPSSLRVAAVRDHLRENLHHPHRLAELAASAGLSVPHFSVLFRKQTGYAPIDFLLHERIQRACLLLDTTDSTVTEIAAQVGYENPFYFSRCFRRIVGCSPRQYRRTAKG